MIDRLSEFRNIASALKEESLYTSDNALVSCSDSLSTLKRVPNQSVSLILTDPPYHSTKKKNIHGDTAFSKDDHFIQWMSEYASEWRRILKPNGSIFCYCSSAMSARLEVMFSEKFNVLSHVVWTKPNEPGFDGWKGKMNKSALRQWYPHSERIIFAEPAIEGNLGRSPFAHFLREARKKSGLSGHQLTELTGAYGKVNHGGAVSNWETGRNVPSREQYSKIVSALVSTGKVENLPAYEDVIRTFEMDGSKEFTDVWNFPSVRPYKGKHPAEKPLSMLKHAIEATTYEGDIVLDCFAGSGSTAIAALSTGRRTISIEILDDWAERLAQKVSSVDKNSGELCNTVILKNKVLEEPPSSKQFSLLNFAVK